MSARRVLEPDFWRQPWPWLVIFGIAIVWLLAQGYVQRQQIRREANRSTNALCALRGDKERQQQSSQAFLIAHPQGAFGFTANDIRAAISDEQRTIDALSGLAC